MDRETELKFIVLLNRLFRRTAQKPCECIVDGRVPDSRVVDSRAERIGRRRRIVCPKCRARWTTHEIPLADFLEPDRLYDTLSHFSSGIVTEEKLEELADIWKSVPGGDRARIPSYIVDVLDHCLCSAHK